MRRLLAPLARWLDRRIDARIAVCRGRGPLPAGLQPLTDAAAADMRAASTLKAAADLKAAQAAVAHAQAHEQTNWMGG